MSMMRESLKAKDKNDSCHLVTLRHNFFTNRVSEHRNKLSNIVVRAHNLNSLKKIIDDYMTTVALALLGSDSSTIAALT